MPTGRLQPLGIKPWPFDWESNTPNTRQYDVNQFVYNTLLSLHRVYMCVLKTWMLRASHLSPWKYAAIAETYRNSLLTLH